MKCSPIRIGDAVGFVCGPRRLNHCRCGRLGVRQCDFRTAPGKTCDAYLCAECAVPQGRNRDFCPHHPGQGDLFHEPIRAG